jgi:hypothetical protein
MNAVAQGLQVAEEEAFFQPGRRSAVHVVVQPLVRLRREW